MSNYATINGGVYREHVIAKVVQRVEVDQTYKVVCGEAEASGGALALGLRPFIAS